MNKKIRRMRVKLKPYSSLSNPTLPVNNPDKEWKKLPTITTFEYGSIKQLNIKTGI